MIANKIKKEANEFMEYEYLSNGYPIQFIKEQFFNETNIPENEIENYVLMNMCNELIRQWSYHYNTTNISFEYIDKNFNHIIENSNNWGFDGYSQIGSRLGFVDRQLFEDENFIFLFIADVEGGIATVINKSNYEIKFFFIGEDDGSWFISSRPYELITNRFLEFKNYLCSEINELKNIDNQRIIEQIFNLKEFNFIPIDYWTMKGIR